MTAKKKAKELIDKMINTDIMYMSNYLAKQCALIAVDEIIEQESTYDPSISDIRYWQEVKQKIEKL